jgi:N-methylhydantoinase B
MPKIDWRLVHYIKPQLERWKHLIYNSDVEGALVACGDGETYIASAEVYERRMPTLVERYT